MSNLPFRYFNIYRSIRMHFLQDNYDVFASGGAVKGTPATFEKRRDKKLFFTWTTLYDPQKFILLNAANCMYQNFQCVYDQELAIENYIEYERRRQSMTKIFHDDISTLQDLSESNLLLELSGKRITIETCTILREVLGKFQEKTVNGMFEQTLRIMRKANRFVQYDRNKIETVLRREGHMNEAPR